MIAIKWPKLLEVFVLATLVSYLITPFIMMVARRTGYLDYPKSNKVHAHPTPLMGGVSIYIAFVASVLATVNINYDPRLSSVLISGLLLLVVGLIDDKFGMIPEVKLLAQFFAAMIVIKSGVRVDFLHNYYMNIIFTYLWIIGITNAFNLLDNMNGLSAGIAAIAAIFFGIVMWNGHQMVVAVVSFATAGASLGFLKHNFPKAKIFMGDSGSLVLGFLLASTAILGSWSTRFLTTSLAMPVIILAYPIFDTTLVTIMRIKEGRSIFQGGKDHSSHRLSLIGFKKKGAVLVIYSVCIALGVSALIIQRLPLFPAIAVIGAVAVSMLALGVRLAMVDAGRYGRLKRAKNDA